MYKIDNNNINYNYTLKDINLISYTYESKEKEYTLTLTAKACSRNYSRATGKTAATTRKRDGVHVLPYASVYMQTVNLALYPGEGARRWSAIVNFARGEIPRSFLQKPRPIRPRSSAHGTFQREGK